MEREEHRKRAREITRARIYEAHVINTKLVLDVVGGDASRIHEVTQALGKTSTPSRPVLSTAVLWKYVVCCVVLCVRCVCCVVVLSRFLVRFSYIY